MAIQNATASRAVSAAGTTANCIVGALSLLALRRARKLAPSTYFLWIFGAFNLLNIGYLTASAVFDGGDWANVIVGLSPSWVWRCLLWLAGAGLYLLFIRWLASILCDLVTGGEAAAADMWSLVLPAYLAGGTVMTVASIFNPIGPSLILISGAGASFGLNAGLLFVPAMVSGKGSRLAQDARPIQFSLLWLALGLVISGIFIGVLGPGLQFAR